MMKIIFINTNSVNLFFQQKLKTVRMNAYNVNRSSNIQGVKSGTFQFFVCVVLKFGLSMQ